MLTEISLSKFKSFPILDGLAIKPLTILCGANSGGKTSIMKSLLLLKQSYDNLSSTNEATLNGPYVINGLMKDVLYKGKSDSFTIRNKFKIAHVNGNRMVVMSKQDIPTAKELGKITGLSRFKVSYFILDVSCTIMKGIVSRAWDTNYIDKYKISVIPHSLNGEVMSGADFGVELNYSPGGKGNYYDVILSNFPCVNSDMVTNTTLQRCTCYFNGMRLTNLYCDNPEHIKLSDFLNNIYSIFRIVANQYSGIIYLGPLRENPQRQYIISKNYATPNSTGADAPFLIAKYMDRKVREELYPPIHESDIVNRVLPEKGNLIEAVKAWMQYFGLGDIRIKNNGGALQIDVNGSNIVDVGFGVSQTFPIIAEGLSLDYEQTFLLEQPEIHLHPRMQMNMADFLITLANTNHTIIVETHSDHVINRIVRRALESKGDELLDKISIYFVENDIDGSRVSEVKIDHIGGVKDCPKDFFTQFASETNYIIKAGLNNIYRR